MAFEKGGRADKAGNKYEINWVIYQLLKIIDEKIYSVTLEVLGEDERGTDLLIVSNEAIIEHQQCKARNASKDVWEISDLKAKNILQNWKIHLDRDSTRCVSLISPLSCTYLVDLNDRAKNTSGVAKQFYDCQIKNSSKEFNKFYNNFCNEMGLDHSDTNDVARSIDYLKRSFYKQVSEFEIKEWIIQKINYLFSTTGNFVYNSLISLVINGDVLGKEITSTFLNDYFKKENIDYRSINLESRIYPKFNELNTEYDELFFPLKDGFIKRKEAEKSIGLLKEGKSIIIHGKAGYGKSGCTQEIISYCKKEHIPYIAIKLDKHVPIKTCEDWGKSLGLPDSIPHSLNIISKNERAVIILDQLDALRWTQSNSSEAISICMELLRQVRYLNYERDKKITVIFVCRTFDLENDNNIESIFKKKESNKKDVWERVLIDSFENETVELIVGEIYVELPQKLKEILRVPSNLYIWQQLEPSEKNNSCTTTSHLVKKWYEQLKRNCITVGVSERTIIETNDQIVSAMERLGRLYVPKSIIKTEEKCLFYLKSVGLINIKENTVSFVHQSFLDCFISERMLNQFYERVSTEDIIGNKKIQSPGRRYQVQMLLQSILEYSSEDFLDFGSSLLESCNIRYYIKFLFYEILAQITEPDENIRQYIVEKCENEMLLNSVIYGRKQYVKILREEGILDYWYKSTEYKKRVFNLLISIRPNYDIEDVNFLSKSALISDDDDMLISRCFSININEDVDEMFELRMKMYRNHPEIAAEAYIDLKAMLKNCEMRTIKLISFWVSTKIKTKGRNLYRYEDELLSSDDDIFIQQGKAVLDELIQHLPEETCLNFSDWSVRYKHSYNLERTVIELIKKANIACIENNPGQFWNRYEKWMGRGYPIFNEIILHGFTFMSCEFSDSIVEYISEDFDTRIFDLTSGADNKLSLVKKVIEKHTNTCSIPIFKKLENKIIIYKSPKAVDYYKRRINQNKTKEYVPVYWSFWGDLQYELLQCMPPERLSLRGRNLLKVLNRRFHKVTSVYQNHYGHSGSVYSPVSGKTIGFNSWKKIITNAKLENRNRRYSKEVKGGFIESSIEMFSQDFQSVVSKEPEIMLKLVLENKMNIRKKFIDSLFSGIASSEKINLIDKKCLEELMLVFAPNMESWRASYFCDIVERRKDVMWSEEILKILKMIAERHINPILDKPNITNGDDKEMKTCNMIQSNALNCVRGTAARAIGNLLWSNKENYSFFKNTIDILSRNENLAVKYASLWALFPVYNIDGDWAAEKIISLFEEDIRLTCFSGSKNILFLLYSEYRDRVLGVIKKCYESEEEELIKLGSYSMMELHIRFGEFPECMKDISSMSKLQAVSVLHMAVVYLNIDKYNKLSKNLIIKFCNEQVDVEHTLSRMFYQNYVNLDRDKDFLLKLMKSKQSRYIVHAFTNYLEENALSVVEYADIIITLCDEILNKDSDEIQKMLGVEDELSKLIIGLYDETVNKKAYKDVTMKCLDLWDIMFEKQIGSTREISLKLLDR